MERIDGTPKPLVERFSSTATGGKWRRLDDHVIPAKSDAGDVTKSLKLEGSASAFRSFYSDCLAATNLLVLSGLGTSLSVNGSVPQGAKCAPTMSDLWKLVETSNPGQMAKAIVDAKLPEAEKGDLESLLSRCKSAITYLGLESDAGKELEGFVKAAERIIRDACDFVTDSTPLDTHEAFLQRIARRSARKQRTKIFTTNYDLCFEVAAARRRFLVVDGFSFATPPEFDPVHFDYDIVRRSRPEEGIDFIENVFHLYKVHGSITWEAVPGSRQILRKEKAERPLMVYPRESKYEEAFINPYLPLMSSFQSILRQPDTALVVAGFGFRDKHLAEPITAALATNLTLRVLIADPYFFDGDDGVPAQGTSIDERTSHQNWQDFDAQIASAKATNLKDMHRLAGLGDGRVAFFRGTFDQFVKRLPDLPTSTDRDAHRARMDRLNDQSAALGSR